SHCEALPDLGKVDRIKQDTSPQDLELDIADLQRNTDVRRVAAHDERDERPGRAPEAARSTSARKEEGRWLVRFIHRETSRRLEPIGDSLFIISSFEIMPPRIEPRACDEALAAWNHGLAGGRRCSGCVPAAIAARMRSGSSPYMASASRCASRASSSRASAA